MKITKRLKHAWNAFNWKDTNRYVDEVSYGSSYAPQSQLTRFAPSSFANAIFNRIAMDVSLVKIDHVKIDEATDDRKIMKSGLQNCLELEANLDQSRYQFMQDLVFSMFDEGVVAVVPVDTTVNITISETFDIETMRVGQILQWYPKYVTVNLYNDRTGMMQEVTLPKKSVAILENPLYAITNGQNGTLKRLLNKMAQLDNLDELVSSGKLDLIIQTPQQISSPKQKADAKLRVKDIKEQMSDNRTGIAYLDGTEKITQLNRPINNQLIDDVQYLMDTFYNQLGLTKTVFEGTASEVEMRNYFSRTIDPIVNTIMIEFKRKFLTKTARSQGQTLEAYRDPFALVPIEQVAEIGDKFIRNRILTGNEMRRIVGFKSSNDPAADLLYNPNITEQDQPMDGQGSLTPPEQVTVEVQNE